MGLPWIKDEKHFTYGDYLTWPDDERWELIDGVAWNMCAAPNRAHQDAAGTFYRRVGNWLEGKPCRAYIAPFDVLLPRSPDLADDEVDTVVQPDVAVFCDRGKLTRAGARGAPDLALEVLSPWTSRKDLNEKYRLYERVGVREYWVLDPGNRSLQVYRLDGGRFGAPAIFVGGGRAESLVLPGFGVELAELWPEDAGD